MSKPKIPNQKKKYQELNSRLNRYVALVEQIYDTLNLEAAKIALNTEYDADIGTVFKFSDYPQTEKSIADIQAQFVDDIRSVIYRGTSDEWKNSNEVQDLMADKVLKAYTATIDKEKYKVLYQTNSDALKAFQNRRDRGFDVSAKLWQQSTVYKEELEAAITPRTKALFISYPNNPTGAIMEKEDLEEPALKEEAIRQILEEFLA